MRTDQDRALREKLRRAGMRCTRQRFALARLLFAGGHRHVTAEELHREALAAGTPVASGTVYNTLRRFAGAGLLREVAVNSSSAWFDTNVSFHHHFYHEGTGELVDIPGKGIRVRGLPAPPEGAETAEVNVMVRIRDARR